MPPRNVVGIPSEREAQALELVANDVGTPEIALKLGVKQKTVGLYVAQSMAKLGVSHAPAAVLLACSSGLIPLALSRVSVPGVPFRDLVDLAQSLRTATSMDLPDLQARALTVLAALATQNTPAWALCNRGDSSLRPH
ncbi:helix-turn-helix domain-containing protein [Catenulispora rubra]|uniref:helix-turn-helix domain-containing protein n=1 Tax=Catenulispora rubra TaxID=280293 RepID=UPI0018920434|nr:helix-turn-helix transcriptional regulator [Catenulispora rubra]